MVDRAQSTNSLSLSRNQRQRNGNNVSRRGEVAAIITTAKVFAVSWLRRAVIACLQEEVAICLTHQCPLMALLGPGSCTHSPPHLHNNCVSRTAIHKGRRGGEWGGGGRERFCNGHVHRLPGSRSGLCQAPGEGTKPRLEKIVRCE